MRNDIKRIGEKVLGGEGLSLQEVLPLVQIAGPDLMDLAAAANRVREVFCGNRIDLCYLLNAKSGRCSEDCRFCSQSAHYQTDSPNYPLLSLEEIVKAAKEAEKTGTHRFCLISSGRALNDDEFNRIISALKQIKKECRLELDCSLGFLKPERIELLKEAGITRYNHNLEAGKSYFANICTTHSFEDRQKTVKMIKEAGISPCCGGIIGLGESFEQRLELAFTLKDLEIKCVPLNILDPRPGTPLAGLLPLSPLEIIKTIALFRFILPEATIKLAGGRERNLRELQSLALLSGANGIILGGYLTTSGKSVESDLQMLKDLGYSW